MKMTLLQTLSVASLGGALVFSAPAPFASASAGEQLFAVPERIKAGDKYLGERRMYPSPISHDIDGDLHPDLVVGDLIGALTFAPRIASSEAGVRFGAETSMKDRSGERLKFNNW